ncbi:MAG: hypothetical protein JXB17_11740, partial [Bacteroidales bacterium]|nr:hypothetical protein [Bacteroidales bacterium]
MKKSIFIIFLIYISINALTQQYNFRNYSIDKGLVNSTVFSIMQDSRGYIWLGTDGGGVCRFDGINFVTFNTKNGLVDNIVRSLLEDHEGNIWIGTHKGISFYDGINFMNIDESKGLPIAPIFDLYEDSQNNIWAGSLGEGLHMIKLVSKDSVYIKTISKRKEGISANYIFDIYEGEDKELWLALFGGINIITLTGDSVTGLTKLDADYGEIPSNYLLSIEKDSNGDLWFGTRDIGVFKLIMHGKGKGEIIEYSPQNGFADYTVWDILHDSHGNLWFATERAGLIKHNMQGFKDYSEKNGFAGNQVMCLLEDDEGSIWAGTFQAGISQFLGEDFIHITEEDDLTNKKIFDIEQDKYGNYWLASEGDGLIKLTIINNVPKYAYYKIEDGLVSNFTSSLSIAPNGDIWIGTQDGISRFNGKKFKNYTKDFHDIFKNNVLSIFVDSEGYIWCGTRVGLALLSKDEQISIHKEKEEGYELFNQIQTIIEDDFKNIWFGTPGGLLKNDGTNLVYYDEMEGLHHKYIHSLTDDKYGNIWIGTFGGGLYKLDVHTDDSLPFRQMADDQLISSNNIYSLVFLNDSNLIIGTDKGFDRIELDSLQIIIKVNHYDKTNGFIGVENNLNSIYKDNFNNIWFGTVKGLTVYNPFEEKEYFPPPKVHITDIDLFYKGVDWIEKTGSIAAWFNIPGELFLKYKENHLTFKYTGIYLNNPEKVTYKYILEGLETDWSPVRKDNKVTYPGLPHGEYTFKVMAYNDKGEPCKEPAAFDFTIHPPFWKTTWFI